MQEINNNKSVNNSHVNKLAKYSVILGLLSGIFGFFTAIPAIICGHILLYKIKRNIVDPNITNRNMAIGGLIFGYTGLFLWLYLVSLLMQVNWVFFR